MEVHWNWKSKQEIESRQKRLESYVPNFSAPMDSMIYIDFGQSISVDSCIVTIKDSRSGTKYDDICIAEMFLYGE